MSWNFALILFVLLVVTGIVWTLDRFSLRAKRRQKVEDALALARPSWSALPPAEVQAREEQIRAELGRMPWWVEYGVSFFPVILFVFVLRSFIVEPFRIPSGSMLPTLQSGDLILVNKFTYGLRLPVIDTKVIPVGSPQRGDVMVFRYPPRPSVDYIKRVVGVPGDEVSYLNKQLSINGQVVPRNTLPEFFDESAMRYFKQYDEALGQAPHLLIQDDDRPAFVSGADPFPFRENCRYTVEGVVCKVPAGHYFMMGDNRDNSLDSRYWGFVPDANIVGRAFFVWMNFGNLKRIGGFH